MISRIGLFWVLVLVTLLSSSCDRLYSFSNQNIASINRGDWYEPPVGVDWHWQLQGKVDTDYDVDLYDIDLFDSSKALILELQAQDKKVICYFSAGSYEAWRYDAEQFRANDLGKILDGWDEERWLDIRSAKVKAIMQSRLDLAVKKGCDGVEPDNVDGYVNNSGFNLSATDQLQFNRFLAQEAHLRNLAVGLKNDLEQINDLVDYYDFAVNEQCFEYLECDLLAVFIDVGKPVLNAEYQNKYLDNSIIKKKMCDRSLEMQFSTLVLPLNLDNEFRYSCRFTTNN